MKVKYDASARIAGIGVTPWTRLGLEQWFRNYKIVAYRDGGAMDVPHMPPVYLLGDETLAKKNTQHMVRTASFKRIADGELADYVFSTYKPVVVEDLALAGRFLMNDPAHTSTFENKAWLRDVFGASLPFAPYRIVRRQELEATQASYETLHGIGPELVIQHEQLSGGKGTYLVRSYEEFCRALQALPADGRLVVSRLITEALERSVQCCVTRYGTQYGGLQKQLVRNPELCNLDVPVINGFCGGEIGTVAATQAQQETIRTCITAIGDRMAAEGFRGIFGIDFLIRGDEVYLLEVNARLTGLTPLPTMMNRLDRDIPFYLLHTLELAAQEYAIEPQAEPDSLGGLVGGMLILQSQQPVSCRVQRSLVPGVYVLQDGSLSLVRKDIHFAPDDPAAAILVQSYVSPGVVVKPGERLVTAILRRPVMTADDELDDWSRKVISGLYAAMRLDAAV